MPMYYNRFNIAFCLIKDSFSKSVCFPVKFSEAIYSEYYKCGIILDLNSEIDILASQVIELANKLISNKNSSYNREDLGFLDWEKESVKVIYNIYMKIK